MKIQVIGTGCDKCSKLFANVEEAVKNAGVKAEILKVEDLMEIVKLGIMVSPSLMINGKLVLSGTVPSVEKIEGYIRKYM